MSIIYIKVGELKIGMMKKKSLIPFFNSRDIYIEKRETNFYILIKKLLIRTKVVLHSYYHIIIVIFIFFNSLIIIREENLNFKYFC